MRDRYDEFQAAGADVVAIGMGWPEMAAHFKREFEIPFTLLVDHDRATYRALGLTRANAWNVYGPPVWIEGIQSIFRHSNKIPKQDPFQLGGLAVVDKNAEVRFLHRARASSDNPDLDAVLATL